MHCLADSRERFAINANPPSRPDPFLSGNRPYDPVALSGVLPPLPLPPRSHLLLQDACLRASPAQDSADRRSKFPFAASPPGLALGVSSLRHRVSRNNLPAVLG